MAVVTGGYIMSNFIYGNVVCSQVSNIIPSKIDFLMTRFCIDNHFGIHFLESIPPVEANLSSFYFQLSDNFMVHYCEYFLEPIIYTLDGAPQLSSLCNDSDKLYNLIEIILQFDFVETIELRISNVEVDECEYETVDINLDELKSTIIAKYLQTTSIPTLKLLIRR